MPEKEWSFSSWVVSEYNLPQKAFERACTSYLRVSFEAFPGAIAHMTGVLDRESLNMSPSQIGKLRYQHQERSNLCHIRLIPIRVSFVD